MKTLKRLFFISLLLTFFIGIHSTVQAGGIGPGPSPGDLALFELSTNPDNNSITVGDKTFDNWSFSGSEPIADSIYVYGEENYDGQGDIGLRYEAYFGALSLNQEGADSLEENFNFSFRVTTSGDLLIKDNILLGPYGGYVPSVAGTYADLGAEMFESVYGAPPVDGEEWGTKHTYDYWDADKNNYVYLKDSLNFTPIDEIWVSTSIRLWTSLEGQQVEIASFVQTFSQTSPVPEPATMLLLGTGLVGVAGAARRRWKK